MMKKIQPKVSIIILNWNGWKDTIECIESVYDIDYDNYEVILVDNNSQDDSIHKIKEWCNGGKGISSKFIRRPKKNHIKILESSVSGKDYDEYYKKKLRFDQDKSVKKLIILKNTHNSGFAEGNNIAIRQILKEKKSKYVLLLNNDTFVHKDFLKNLVYYGEKDKSFGLLGPVIKYYNSDKIHNCGMEINMKYGTFKFIKNNMNKINEVDALSGCALLIKVEVFKKVGLFDKDFFLYWEETDFCLRARKKNYKCITVKNSIIWHKIGNASGSIISKTQIYYSSRNNILFMYKNTSIKKFIIFLIVYIIYSSPIKIITLIKINHSRMVLPYIKGILNGISIIIK